MKAWKLLTAGVVVAAMTVGVRIVTFQYLYSEANETAWTYRSPEQGFSVVLPSRAWRDGKKPDCAVFFHNSLHSALVTVHLNEETKKTYDEKAIPNMTQYFERSREELVGALHHSSGVTQSGKPFALWMTEAKAEKGGTVFFALALVHCKEQQRTLKVAMEAPLSMQSQSGKDAEWKFLENSAKSILLSVD